MDKRQAVISLGSNLGDSSATINAAVDRLAATPGIELVALSSLYTTEPAVVSNQPLFTNAVALLEAELPPKDLLHVLQAIETDFGRVREGRDYVPYGPRTLDLDIIDMEGVVSDDPELTLPHPEALHRAFVVTPLLEVSPCHVLANQKVVNDSLVNCGEILADTLENCGDIVAEATQGDDADCPLLRTTIDSDCPPPRTTIYSDCPPPRKALDLEPTNLLPGKALDSELTNSLPGKEQSAPSPRPKEGRLSVCATPIGNLGDITLRVLEALKSADVIYCEDTRVTRKLTTRYEITTPLRRADAHKLPELLPIILAQLEKGSQLAYVSDAGMPGISDPGGLLVAAVREAGYVVAVLPGASALTTALTSSGIKAHNHYFGGYFPRKAGAGRRLLESLSSLDDTVLVFYESVHRTAKTLRLIAEVLPTSQVVMARELTKLHEEVLAGTAPEVAAQIDARTANNQPLKGEVVLLVAPSQEHQKRDAQNLIDSDWPD